VFTVVNGVLMSNKMQKKYKLEYQEAARAIASADFLLVAAGAGLSADSGLPV
jgi:hypothetical protein